MCGHPSAYSAPAGQTRGISLGSSVSGVLSDAVEVRVVLCSTKVPTKRERDSFVIQSIWLVIGLVDGRWFTFIVTNFVRMSAGPFDR